MNGPAKRACAPAPGRGEQAKHTRVLPKAVWACVTLLFPQPLTPDNLPPREKCSKCPSKPPHCPGNSEGGAGASAFHETTKGVSNMRAAGRPLSCFLSELTSETLPLWAAPAFSDCWGYQEILGANARVPVHPTQPCAGGEGRANVDRPPAPLSPSSQATNAAERHW